MSPATVTARTASPTRVTGRPRRLGRATALVAAGALAAAAGAVGYVVRRSPGTPRAIVDDDGADVPGSLSEKIWVSINGSDQGMFIASRDTTNPVLLFVHGGPGMPEYFLEDTYPTGLEQDFTVVWWEQRGAGLSAGAATAQTMTVEQFVQDTLAVTDYLRDRFGVDKIYLMGHSWGTLIAIQAAAAAPERYHAYVGVAQITDQAESEALSHAWLLEHYRALNDEGMVARLEAVPVVANAPLPAAYEDLRDAAMHRAGVGTTRDMTSVTSGVFAASWRSPIYTAREKLGLWRAKTGPLQSGLVAQMYATDLRESLLKVDVPVYFLHGAHDQTVSGSLARAYLDDVEAPVKGFYTFDDSAHSPIFEEPELVRTILREDVLTGTTGRADHDTEAAR